MSGIGGQVREIKTPPRSFVPITAVWLRKDGSHAVVLVEIEGKWVRIGRELADGMFSHITEARGIDACAEDPNCIWRPE
jgi:hypothetical protein